MKYELFVCVFDEQACLDAIYAETDDKCKSDATKYMNENMRVLRKDGFLFTISMSQDFICKLLYGKMFSYYSITLLWNDNRQKW